MAYTPELSLDYSRTLRRLAWALGMPMTEAMKAVFDYAADVVDRARVCAACKDKTRCQNCVFRERRRTDGTAKLRV